MNKKIYILFFFILIFVVPISVLAKAIPNDTLFSKQNYLEQIKASKAWDFSTGQGIVIAVLDSGIDINHPDLKNNIWVNPGEIPFDNIDNDNNGYVDDIHGWDFVDYDNNPSPNFYKDCLINGTCNEIGLYHGTIISGVIAAEGNNGQGITGLAYGAKIMPIKVLDDSGSGNMRSVIEGINYAINKKADIINLSLVGSERSEMLDRVLKKAHNKGIVIVAASGNDDENYGGINLSQKPLYPVCDKEIGNIILGVGAVNNQGNKLGVSNYGSNCIDISTVGENFYSTIFYDKNSNLFTDAYSGWWTGTSVSTALVSGTVALVKSIDLQISNKEVEETITKNVDPFTNLESKYKGEMGPGVLDSFLAVKATADKINLKPKEQVIQKTYLMASSVSQANPKISFYNLTGDVFYVKDLLVYNKNFQGGVNSASGDLTGNGQAEIVTGTGNTGGSQVRVFDQLGRVKSQFFASDKKMRGGVNVAVGQMIDNHSREIITGAGVGEEPYVRVFDMDGNLIFNFLAYGQNFLGGVRVAVGDVDGDGINEIITGAGYNGGPHIRIFDRFGRLKSQFFAYSPNLRLGVRVAVGDVDGDGVAEIITGLDENNQANIKVFDLTGKIKSNFFLAENTSLSQVKITIGDIDNDNKDEIIVSIGNKNGTAIKIFDLQGNLLNTLDILDKDFQKGVNLAIIKVKY